jgi:phage/conjugal plasmid C-4 type zinc finger TraR family protein
MTNPADLAQDIELADYERNQKKAIMPKVTRPSAERCEECEEKIPKGRRLAVPGVRYCIECQLMKDKYDPAN